MPDKPLIRAFVRLYKVKDIRLWGLYMQDISEEKGHGAKNAPSWVYADVIGCGQKFLELLCDLNTPVRWNIYRIACDFVWFTKEVTLKQEEHGSLFSDDTLTAFIEQQDQCAIGIRFS